MNTTLTLGQRRRRVVDAGLWALLLSILVLYVLAPLAGALTPGGATLVVALYFYLPVLTAAMMVAFSWFGYGVEGYEVVSNHVWAAALIAYFLGVGVAGGRGVIWLSALSITYLLCERLLPEPASA